MTGRIAACALAFLVLAPGARAVGPGDFVGTRTLGMAAARAAASGNEAIFLNPAGLGAAARYALQVDYNHDTSGSSGGGGDALVVSIADSLSNPRFPTGLAYRYVSAGSGDATQKGHFTDFAMAFPVGGSFLLGGRLTYFNYTVEDKELQRITGDLGLLLGWSGLSVGVVGFNLVNVDSPDSGRGLGAGISYGDERLWRVAADYRLDFTTHAVHSFSAGAELLVAEAIPLRGGYIWDNLRGREFWSAGTGLLFSQFGVDASFRRDRRTGENLLGFSIKVFMQ